MIRFNSTNNTDVRDLMFGAVGTGAAGRCTGGYNTLLYRNVAALWAKGPFKVSQNSESPDLLCQPLLHAAKHLHAVFTNATVVEHSSAYEARTALKLIRGPYIQMSGSMVVLLTASVQVCMSLMNKFIPQALLTPLCADLTVALCYCCCADGNRQNAFYPGGPGPTGFGSNWVEYASE
jgi:hypothetical protein